MHGSSWKRLYFERHLTDFLEAYDTAKTTTEDLLRLLSLCKDFVFRLAFQQLPAHLALETVFQSVPTLAVLDAMYGAQDVGMDYERSLFGMQPDDVASLSRALRVTETLTVLRLRSNSLNDTAAKTLGARGKGSGPRSALAPPA